MKEHKTYYSFSWTEDALLGILTIIYVIIFRGLYDSVAFLLAITIAVLLAWFSVLFLRLFSAEYVHLGNIALKQGGKIKVWGRYFIGSALFVFFVTVHSAYIHYHSYRGNLEYAAFIKNNGLTTKTAIVSDESKGNLKLAQQHLELADGWGLYSPLSLNRKLAAIYLANMDYVNAEKYLNKMLSQNPDDNEARLRLAKILFVSNRESNGVSELQKIINGNYKTVQELKVRSEAHLTLGHIEEKNGFGSSAMNNYRQSIKDNPANMEAMLAYGVILSQNGQLAEAENYLLKCNEVMPGSALIHNNLSAIYIRMKKDNLAIKHLSELIRLQPENFQAYYNLGMLFLRAEKSKQAIQYLQIALTIKPDYANAHIGLAKALYIEGQKSEADFHKQKSEELKLIAQNKN